MFTGKVYLYKNINGKEQKIEKEFDDEKKFNQYIEKNPDIKKMKEEWKNIDFPQSFRDMKRFFEDFDMKLLGKQKYTFFDELSEDFEDLMKKSKKLLGSNNS